VLGQLESVHCLQALVVLHVRIDGGLVLRLAAPGFDRIDFISYRPDPPGGVRCGPLPEAHRVLATYRTNPQSDPTPDSDGQAVAVELIPDGYVPR
jgi:hypothetical protein